MEASDKNPNVAVSYDESLEDILRSLGLEMKPGTTHSTIITSSAPKLKKAGE